VLRCVLICCVYGDTIQAQVVLVCLLAAMYTVQYLTFRGPRIVIYSYNKSQRDALFLKFIFIKNSTCFGQIYCPSLGVLILYSQQLTFVTLVMLTVC